LQPALMDLARHAGKMHVHDLRGYRATNRFHAELYPSDVDEGFRSTSALTSMLAVRVNDAKVRVLTAAFQSAASNVGGARNPTDSNSSFDTMSQLFVELQGRIGVVLRELDEDESKQQEGLTKKK
jgi:hypothetical protein